jgi:hypothetical protein
LTYREALHTSDAPMAELDKIDVRTYHRHIRKGQLTQEEYDKYLASLPDLEESAEFVDYDTRFRIEAEEEARRAAIEAAEAAKNPPPRPPSPPSPATATALAPDRVSLDEIDDMDDDDDDDDDMDDEGAEG